MSDALPHFPAQMTIEPMTGLPRATVRVPGSKSITNRALVLAALARSTAGCRLTGALQSEDTEVMLHALGRLGFAITVDWSKATILVHAKESGSVRIPVSQADLFVANSGTSMRFLTAMVSLGHGHFRLDGVPRMRERPIEDLLSALRQLGVSARSETGNGCPPVLIDSQGLRGGAVSIESGVSSQFLSGLLMAAPYANSDVTISVAGNLVSEPYVVMTVRMIEAWGLKIDQTAPGVYRVPGNQRPAPLEHHAIEPDASAASYFWAAAAITGGSATVEGLSPASLQGDVRFVDLLEQMGCRAIRAADRITVEGRASRGIDVDMNDISDTVMTLGAVACFAESPTTIRNVAHIRHKETDRLAALAIELRRLGAAVDESADGLTITPRLLHGAAVETYNDHRMAMSLALVGLRVPGVIINNPGCVAKTYPHFFEDLHKLRLSAEV